MLERRHIKAPTRHDPGKGFPTEHLAYLAPWEMELLRQLTDGTISRGPKGIPSFVAPPSGGGVTKTNYNSGPGTVSSSGGSKNTGPTAGLGSNYSQSSGYKTSTPSSAGSKNTGETKTASSTSSSSGGSKAPSSSPSAASRNAGPSQGPMSAGQPSANRGPSQSSAPSAASRNTSQGPTGVRGPANTAGMPSVTNPTGPAGAPSRPSEGGRKPSGPASPMAGQGSSYANPAAAMAANKVQSLKNQLDAASRGLQGISNTPNPSRGITPPSRDPGNPSRGVTVPTRDPTLGNPSRGIVQPTMAPSYPGRGVTVPTRDPTAGNPSRGITPPTTPPSYPGRGITVPTRDPRAGNPSRGKTVPTAAPMANPSRGITVPTAPPQAPQPGLPSGTDTPWGGRKYTPDKFFTDPERSGPALRSLVNNLDLMGERTPAARANSILKTAGVPDKVRAGMMGNFAVESGSLDRFNPEAWWGDEGEQSYGIGQWREGRLDALNQYGRDVGAKMGPRGPLDAADQAAFALNELGTTEKRAWNSVNKAKTVEDATRRFARGYERMDPARAHMDRRIAEANRVYGGDLGGGVAVAGADPISYTPPAPQSRVPNALGSIAGGIGNALASPGRVIGSALNAIPNAQDVKNFTGNLPSQNALGLASMADKYFGTNVVGDAIGGGIRSGLNAVGQGVNNMMGNVAGGLVAAPETISNLGSTRPPAYNEGSGRMPTSQEVASANKSSSSSSKKASRDKSSSERNDAIRRRVAQQLMAQEQQAATPVTAPIVPPQIGYVQLSDAEREAILRQLLGEDWA